jgi:valyl-tRNA synthetase
MHYPLPAQDSSDVKGKNNQQDVILQVMKDCQQVRSAAKRIGRLKGQALVQARQAVYDCLKTNGYDPKTLSSSRQTPYILKLLESIH